MQRDSELFISNEDEVQRCPQNDLFICWLSALTMALQKNNMADIMQSRSSEEPSYYFVLIYQFTYYILVITVLLNVIFGIIIDTFGELRTKGAQTKRQMENTCFICGVERFVLDTRGGGFQRHIDHDHNMWSYLFMLAYIAAKDPTDYNGWEQYVAEKVPELPTCCSLLTTHYQLITHHLITTNLLLLTAYCRASAAD